MTMPACVLSAACCFAVWPALAQTPAPSAPPAAAASTGSPTLKSVRQSCRAEIKGQSLKGDAHRQAMVGCMTKAMPDKSARIACMFDPKLQGEDHDARRVFVKSCAAKANG